MLGKRILFGYAGLLFAALALLPIGLIESSRIAVIAIAVLVGRSGLLGLLLGIGLLGLLIGFIISDWKRRLTHRAILMRTIIALVAALVWFIVLFGASKISPFLSDQGWAFLSIGGPLVAALASEFVFLGSVRDQSSGKKSG